MLKPSTHVHTYTHRRKVLWFCEFWNFQNSKQSLLCFKNSFSRSQPIENENKCLLKLPTSVMIIIKLIKDKKLFENPFKFFRIQKSKKMQEGSPNQIIAMWLQWFEYAAPQSHHMCSNQSKLFEIQCPCHHSSVSTSYFEYARNHKQ